MSIEPDQSLATDRAAIPVDSFGNRLMLARAHAGHISIREAADLCDIGRGAWTNWEKGARPADIIEIAAVVADKLGVDREWLLFGGPQAEVGRRSLRRLSRGAGTTTRGGDLNASSSKTTRSALDRPAHRRSSDRRADTPTIHTGSPLDHQRRDSKRPVSAPPVSSRRPQRIEPGTRPIAS